MQKPQLQTIFQAPFNENSWVEMLKSLFKVQHQRIVAEELTPGENEKGFYYGYSDVKDYKIGFFRYKIEKGSVVHRKSGLRNLVKIFTNQDWGRFDAAVVAFHDEKHWRLSFICDLRDEKTNPKRFTFLFGDENCSYRTAVDRFSTLQEKEINFQNLRDTFSVDMLTKEFYNELFAWYSWAIDPKTGVNFPNDKKDKNIKEDDSEQIDTKIIRMITRIMFVWFIKQKNLVPNHLFDAAFLTTILKDFEPQNDKNGNFYNAILQNLFFATLNHDINERRFATNQQADIKSLYRYKELFADSLTEADVINLFAEIPFLNGGLFECLDKTVTMDGVVKSFYNDGFSRNARTNADGRPKYRAVVPNILFFEPEKGLFSILNRYNFTVEENTPTEQQVALDPELLGKVFENLLGAYNPETKETARNQSGSFYTPREIVNYMVDESLIAYLQTVVKSSTMCETAKNDFIRDLFSDDFRYDDLKWQEYQGIIGKLMTIKILDPACGSGAFPMGVLNRLVDILKKLDPNKTTYDVKLKLIENCIYGIDIQTIAMQISKLRFFISLICDAEKQAGAPNFGIPTLPNLETKFVCANSLISKKKRAAQGNLFENPRIEPVKEELIRIRHDHFNAKNASAKKNLRDDDTKLRTELANLLKENDTFAPEDAQQFAQWNPYDQNACSPFFDSEWMFGVNDGFDIVIGNPPYVQLQNNNGELGKLYAPCEYKSYARTGDIYQLFYEQGNNFLKPKGHLCYITSNKWMRAGYGEASRKFFAEQTNPKLLIDFAGTKVFESATVDTNILLFEKNCNQKQTQCCTTKKLSKDDLKNLSHFVKTESSTCQFTNGDSWVILSPIEQSIKNKIEKVGTPLKDWDIQINYGIKTGFNEAFIINTEKRDEILANCQTEEERKKTEELIRPILRGRDIKRYSYEWADLWLINTHNGVRGKFPRIEIEDYPAVKAHLDQYWDKIVKRDDQGATPYNLRNCAYMEDFFKPKVVWTAVNSEYRFTIIPQGIIFNNSLFMITGEKIELICAFFNSTTIKKFLTFSLSGDSYAYGSASFFEKIPIPRRLDNNVQKKIESLVSLMLQKDNEQTETEINHLIYQIYQFTDEEIQFIKQF